MITCNSMSPELVVYSSNNAIGIGLTPEVSAILSSARQKMHEEANMRNLANSNAAVQAALDNFNKAKEHLKITIILANNEKTTS